MMKNKVENDSISFSESLLLFFIHVINLSDDAPGAIEFDERVEVRIVGSNRVILHVDAHHRCRRRYRKHVEPRLDVGAVPFFSTNS